MVSASTVAGRLVPLGYSRPVARTTNAGSHHPDREGQFQQINRQAPTFKVSGRPVISVDTKMKELMGAYTNVGSADRAADGPDKAKTHDFVDTELGKIGPNGSYYIVANTG